MALLRLHMRSVALALFMGTVTLYFVSARPPTEIDSLPGIDTCHYVTFVFLSRVCIAWRAILLLWADLWG
jgi:hypothetical protein